MKKTSWLFYFGLLTLVALTWSCHDEEHGPAKPGNVRFTIDARALHDARGGRIVATLPVGSSLYITIADGGGNDVYTLKQVSLLELGSEYISEPLLLPPGDYTLTEFLVADADDHVVYATPKEDSPLAPYVNDPLPAAFVVNGDAITGLDVQVLAINDHSAEEFGYVTFRVELLPFPYFKLAVFAHDSTNGLAFSPVRAYVLDGADTVYKQSLPAGIQDIAFHGDLSHTYTLVLTQPSYRRYTQTFVLHELVSALSGAALTVTLTPAFTFMAAFPGNVQNPYSFSLNEGVQDLTVDWGDGVIEPVVPQPGGYLEHAFADESPLHFVSVYGNLNSITATEFYYSSANTTEISIVYLPALRVFASALATGPIYMDFTHNPLIEEIVLEYSYVRSFDLPEGAKLRHFDVLFNDSFSESSFNEAIQAAYRGRQYGQTGELYLSYSPHATTGFIAPVSEESLEMLRELRDSYNWMIWPYEF
jgi:hypothetical protein